ncbi:P-loop containing nucleoside triphosphate hydrolase protein [Mycena rebaudengoi]|nr:P-loop containing nucleoside triphosphate hydrolase protein [Mycena rebaudengoi]
MDDARARKLNKLFLDVLHGTQALTNHNFSLYLEAICRQSDPAACVNRITGSPNGLASLQQAMRFNLTPTFFNGGSKDLIFYLQAPELKNIGGGDFLRQVIKTIIDPPIFWTPFFEAFQSGHLAEGATQCFAWLLLQLILLPSPAADPYLDLVSASLVSELTGSSQLETRTLGHKIKQVVEACNTGSLGQHDILPGGRHDNDFADYRRISILPTADEVASKEPPFLRRCDPAEATPEPALAVGRCLDDQFRLLREDMIYEIRDELQIAFGQKKGFHRGLVVEGFTLQDDIYRGSEDRRQRWGIILQCHYDMWFFKGVKDRRAFLDEKKKYFKHQSLTCLIVNDEVVAFPTIHRDEDLLARKPPVVVLQLEGETNTIKALLKLKETWKPRIKLIQIDTAIFSYEPVLKALQEMKSIPLSHELLCWSSNSIMEPPSWSRATRIVDAIQSNPGQDLRTVLSTPGSKPINLDDSQAASLVAGLTQKVSLIQGPPGTGKSFIGALLAKIFHDSHRRILVVCYTNHALDEFLEGILDIGVPQSSIVRLGGKSTQRTECLSLHQLTRQNNYARLQRGDWQTIDSLKANSRTLLNRLENKWKVFTTQRPNLLEHTEFEDPSFFAALSIPPSSNQMTQVGKGGKQMNKFYLFNRWAKGEDAGMFKTHAQVRDAPEIWKMERSSRKSKLAEWESAIRKEQVADISTIGKASTACLDELDVIFGEKDASIIRSKQIIGCTTTGAAKYTKYIQSASPEVLIVEEAGEILESHVITALGSETQQMVLIGDHKQLRPKVNNYMLTVEKGEGYDLNRSMFERLVLKGYPHEILTQQHRMRPEISALIRALTYPDLVDAPSTMNRPNLRGVRDNMVFISHNTPEDENSKIKNESEMGSKSSKRNKYEAQMVLKIVKYLGQQGYGTDKLVVLTPYLGQLQELQSVLAEENDPVLNDLDSHDLVKAGLLPPASAKISKGKLRLATIDNYQGEESDIVISCLTRSNTSHDIGFMFAPERLNVLLSRPRNAFIMIGNVDTFMNARKGGELWTKYFGLLRAGGHVYDGLPVKCERHPDRTALLKSPADFANECPEGGCKEPCGTMLNCGVHSCTSKCHQLSDHSKMACQHIIESMCSKGHSQSWKCHERLPAPCAKCDREEKLAKEKREKQFNLQKKRDADQLAYQQKLAAIDEEIASRNQELRDAQTANERAQTIKQKEIDLENTKARVQALSGVASSLSAFATSVAITSLPSTVLHAPTTPPVHTPPQPTTSSAQGVPRNVRAQAPSVALKIPVSASRDEWQRQKDMEGANNDAIDAIMEMIGLEEVKSQVLKLKAKIDTSVRQGASLKQECFNTTFLGNPGTGKTTVARHYGKFLTSVGILPGSEFVETSGSRLSNDGVPGVKKMIEDVLNAGGGTIFVDEAYQLTSPKNFQGPQVLDFLLAEMQNNVGIMVFIFAGYQREMESFFEHNPGLTSRIPYQLHFADYTDSQLLGMLDQLVEKTFSGKMKVEDGIGGLYTRISVRRLGRGRGRPGFGNARALGNIGGRGRRPDDYLLTQEDLIGPDPSHASRESAAWAKLQTLIGLGSVKQSVQAILSMVETNYNRELVEKAPMELSFNHVFLGSPGTGKTTVAKLYGQILADLGLISNGEVVVKNPADFIGNVMGASESNTKAILANTLGKVLVIDEAYMLYGGGTGSQNDPYKTAVIDTIVAEIQDNPGDDRCVLMLGYEEQMVQMFQHVNPGLSRRFSIETAFRFDDFTDSELLEILNLKLEHQQLDATDAAKRVAIDVLGRGRIRPNFGNAGEVENMLGEAKKRKRSFDVVFEPQDFDPEFDRNNRASTNLVTLFEDVVGCEDIITKLGEYQMMASSAKARGMDVQNLIPTNWVFKGPPGTGKTTVARKMGQVYYDMGFLASAKVEECSASDLVGQYVGQTGPKTKQLFDKALGQVLFIDEAYRLGEGPFAKEAMDEVVGLLTNPRYQSKIVVILAGYDAEMNALLSVNTGLSSRFPEELIFRNMNPEQCLEVLRRELVKHGVHLESVDISTQKYKTIVALIEMMSRLPSWGNARDIKTISKKMISVALRSPIDGNSKLTLKVEDAISCMQAALEGLQNRSHTSSLPAPMAGLPQQMFDPLRAPIPAHSAAVAQSSSLSEPELDATGPERAVSMRDAGVTDATWYQLEADRHAAETKLKLDAEAIQQAEKRLQESIAREQEQIAEARKLAETRARDEAERNELKRQLEEIRLRELMARAERERLAQELEERRKAEALERQKEAKAQAKLQELGVCVAGYRWIKQAGGYRCAGGYHFVDNIQLGL